MVASRGCCAPLPPLCHGRGDTRSFRPPPLCPIESEAVAGRASQKVLPLLRAGAHCPRSSGLQPCLITVMGVPGCRWAAGVGRWARGRVMEPRQHGQPSVPPAGGEGGTVDEGISRLVVAGLISHDPSLAHADPSPSPPVVPASLPEASVLSGSPLRLRVSGCGSCGAADRRRARQKTKKKEGTNARAELGS